MKVVRRIVRAALILIGLVAAAALAALLWARTDAGRTSLRRLVLAHARRVVPGLDIARIRGDFSSWLVAEGIVVRDREGRVAVEAERVGLRFNLLALLRHRVAIEELRIEKVQVVGRPLADGSLNLSALFVPSQPSPGAAPSRWTVAVAALHVREGTLSIANRRDPPLRAQLAWLDGAAQSGGGVVRVRLDALEVALAQGPRRHVATLSGAEAALGPSAVKVRIEKAALWGLLRGGPVMLTGAAQGPRNAVRGAFRLQIPPRGQVALAGLVDLSGRDAPSYQVTASLSRLDPHAFAPHLLPGSLSARVQAQGRALPLEPGSFFVLAIELGPSWLQGIPVRSARLDATSQEGRWTLRGATVEAPGASVRARGQGDRRFVSFELTASLDAVGMRRLPIRQLPPGLRGHGQLQVRLSGPLPPSQATLEGRAWVQELALRDTRIGSAELSVRAIDLPRAPKLKLSGRLSRLTAGALAAEAAHLEADLSLERGRPRGTIAINAHTLALGPNLRLDAAGVRIESAGSDVRLLASGAGPRGSGALAAHATVEAEWAQVTLERLEVVTPRLKAGLDGPAQVLWRAGDVLELAGLNLWARGDRLAGRLAARARYRLHPYAQPRMEAQVSVRDGVVGELSGIDADLRALLHGDRAQATLDGTVGPRRLPFHLDVDAPVAASGPLRLAERGQLRAHVVARSLPLEQLPLPLSLARRGIKRATVTVDGEVGGEVASPQARIDLVLSDLVVRDLKPVDARLQLSAGRDRTQLSLRAQLGGAEVLALDARAALPVAQLVRAGAQPQALADTSIDLDGRIQGLALGELAGLDPRFAGLRGQLEGTLRVIGRARQPSGRLDLAVRGAEVDGLSFGAVELHAQGDAHAESASLHVEQASGGTLEAQASMDRTGSPPGLEGRVRARQLDVGFARLLSAAIRETGGRLDADVRAQGPLNAPTLVGTIQLSDGKLGPREQPTIEGVRADIAITPQKLELKELTARSGDGSLRAHGTVALAGARPQSFALDATAKDFLLAYNGIEGSRLDGELHLRGRLEPESLWAQLDIPSATAWVPKLPDPRKLQSTRPHEDQVFIDREGLAARQGPAAGGREVDFRGQIGTLAVRGKEMDFDLEGDLSARIGKDGRQVLRGALEVRRGSLEIQNRRYDIERARLFWDGDPDHPEPHLDIRLSHVFAEATVAIELHGTAKKPELRLESDPGLEEPQILSLILTGEVGGVPSDQRIDPAAAVSSLVLAKLADKIAPELGVDILRVEQQAKSDQAGKATGETDTRVEVGKYITERVFLSYVHVFGANDQENRNEAHVEYRMTRRWLLQTTFGDAGVGGLDVFWTYRY